MHSAVSALPKSFRFCLKWLVPARTMEVIWSFIIYVSIGWLMNRGWELRGKEAGRENVYLGKTVLAGEARAAVALHQAGGGVSVVVVGGLDTDVAGALLHDDGEDDTGIVLVVLLIHCSSKVETYRSSTPILAHSLTAFQMRPMSSPVSPVCCMADLLALKISSKDFHWFMGGKLEAGPE